MNFNQLRYFITVAESQSFTKAAAAHYISQTAITQQIQALEEQLKVTLIDRTVRPIALTPAGVIFLMEAKAVCERMNQAMEKTKETSAGVTGSIRIGYLKGYERSNLSDVLRSFHKQFPNILLSCFRANSDRLAAGLLNGEYDIIFTWDSTDLMGTPQMECRLYEKVPLVVAMPRSHPFSNRSFLTRKDLEHETILYLTPASDYDSIGDRKFMELYHQAGYQPNIVFRSNDVESILMMVDSEEGISILPAYTTAKLVNADNLVFLPLVGDEEYEQMICAWRADITNESLARFLEKLPCV